MGRVTKFPTSRCPTGTQGQATSLPLMSSLSRTNTISDLLKRRKKRRSRILTRRPSHGSYFWAPSSRCVTFIYVL
ncbi:uncharacterized protein LOC142566166 isoform X4 [Dermacentor variabilis]|uniref:uncharacterized protein LOC142566166 isoform X4 n=1 Tax=Dermacentor variabilis TaxID=34621 RepID=UPI003F5C7CC1